VGNFTDLLDYSRFVGYAEVITKGRRRVPTSIAAAKQFTWVSTDSPPLILSPRYVKILVRRNCGHGG